MVAYFVHILCRFYAYLMHVLHVVCILNADYRSIYYIEHILGIYIYL